MSQSSKTIHDFQRINTGSAIRQIILANSSITLGGNNSNDIIVLNSTSGSNVILPTPSKGLSFPIVISNIGDHTITAPSPVIYGSLSCAIPTTGSSLLSSSASTVIKTTSGSVIGDRIELMSDGTNYYVTGTVKQYNALTFV